MNVFLLYQACAARPHHHPAIPEIVKYCTALGGIWIFIEAQKQKQQKQQNNKNNKTTKQQKQQRQQKHQNNKTT